MLLHRRRGRLFPAGEGDGPFLPPSRTLHRVYHRGGRAAPCPLATVMARSGRRPGLFMGYIIGAVGALLAVLAAATGFFPLLPLAWRSWALPVPRTLLRGTRPPTWRQQTSGRAPSA